MAINVTVNTTSNQQVQVKPTSRTQVTLSTVPRLSYTLNDLVDVDTTGSDNGEVLKFDSANNIYIIAEPTELDSNNITGINGGLF